MNKRWYYYGNFFKVKFRKHNCYNCGEKLMIVKHRKVVDQKSEEAKYYDFDAGGDGGIMVGPCEFIHKVFYCSKCSEDIEFVTQINQEDIDILIGKVTKIFNNKDRKITIKKFFESENDMLKENFKIEMVKNLCLLIEENGKESLIYKIPIIRKKNWERPYYFKVTKKDLIAFIKNNSKKDIS